MTKQKSNKKALLLSFVSLLSCCVMLLGTTFAWFTDTVSSMNNIIASGNLDVVLEYKTAWSDNWTEVDETTKIFDEAALYEPGYTEVVFLRVSNAGSLALKYQLSTNIVREKSSVNVYGEEFFLSDHLTIGTYKMPENNAEADTLLPVMFGSRSAALSNMQNPTRLSAFSGIVEATAPIEVGDNTAQIVVLVLHMGEDVGNEANHKSDVARPEVTFGLNLLATQLDSERDPFGSDYDAQPTLVTNAEQLKSALQEGLEPILPNGLAYQEPEGAIVVWDNTELSRALVKANSGSTVFLPAGEYQLPQLAKTDIKNITVVGSALTKVNGMVSYKTNIFNNFTFQNIDFIGDVKAVFYGNCIFKNCTFTGAGITRQAKLNKGATLTVEDCTFIDCIDCGALWFQDSVSTIVVRNCNFVDSVLAFAKSQNITLTSCDFSNSQIRCFGPVTVSDSAFDSTCMVGPSASAVVDVIITLDGCTMDTADSLTSICYFSGNPKGVLMQFVIDGISYNTDQVTQNPEA